MCYSSSKDPLYALSTGNQDQERLTILNELYNESSLQLLNLDPGMRILTIGCGIGLLELEIAHKITSKGFVIATDISFEQLLIAEENKKNAGLRQLQFIQMEALDIEKIPGQFDRIHCRLVLTHFPLEKALQVIDLLYNKIAPGGFLLVEEIATLDSLYCEPVHVGYEKWKIEVQKQFILQHSDSSPGKKIFQYLQDRGHTLSYSSYQPILSTLREKSLLSLGVHSISKKCLDEQLTTPEATEEMLSLLYQLEQDSNFFPRYSELSQIKIEKH